ncbi:luciferase domain-containing protein [Paenibacillus glycanilyticus]|uniref:luciferase domain-containing protein n=1 Tax=Paenibacillus glycanilyticus TaxID=126569 RepID=UPI00191086C8|nr:luciferase family protein [Paenibacillus glycanilyticus]
MGNKAVLEELLLSWPGVTTGPHRFGGIEFAVNGKEIGHLHGERLVDLLLPKAKRDEAVTTGKARSHHILPESGWVSVYLNTEDDLAHAIELLRFNYERFAQEGNVP